MVTASDFADWWDDQHRDYHKLLEDFVDENPQWWAVGLATLATIPTGLGAGIVDVARLGQGTAKGGIKGVGMDVLRALAIVGPAGRVVRYAAKGPLTALARLMPAPRTGQQLCTWVAAARALRQTGVRLFATVDDLAKTMGNSLRAAPTIEKLGQMYAVQLVPVLRRLGAQVRVLGTPRRWSDVAKAVDSTDGVVLFAIRWPIAGGKHAVHTVYAFKDMLGRLRYADPSGKVVSSMAELGKVLKGSAYKYIAQAAPYGVGHSGSMVAIQSARMIPTASEAAALALPVAKLRVLNQDAIDPEVVMEAFSARKAARNGSPIRKLRKHRSHENLPPVDTIKGVQARLNNLGYGAAWVDGICGSRTRRAVVRFQRDYPDLRADGIPGPKTQAKLADVHGS